ncbi:MAG: DNA repair protein RecN [Deltaproteobacteria bacterium]|jgi:DNA repair protein RecN (Recombination protein N)|nr:DNA repair protein RecN [Deltaproteobacteria bacterium]
MLVELKVSNLALIRELTLSFGPGANILTGETGAGKSILAGALGLLRGAKSSAGLIRAGEDEARVEALFELERPEALSHLFGELGLQPSEDLIVQRTINQAGRSKIRINGHLATVGQLAALGEELLAVSGQHDQQSLVREARQLDFLDAYGGYANLLTDMAAAHKARAEAAAKKDAIIDRLKDGQERRELYEYQLNEITKIHPQPGEDLQLADLKIALKSAGKLSKTLEGANSLLTGRNGEGLIENIDRLARLLEKAALTDERFTPLGEAALECSALLGDLNVGLNKIGRDLPKAPESPEELDDRLSDIIKLKRKYGPSLEEVIEKASWLEETLTGLDSAALELSQAEKELQAAAEKSALAALALRQSRDQTAKSLVKNLTATLRVLGFPKLTMSIEVSPVEADRPVGLAAGPKGADNVTFLFCPNPGEGLKPISKIASGGELSRVMMALKIAQEPASDQSLVFDEIDSGLSGATAEAVAAKMAELSTRQQILIITHLPQMASISGKHFQVFKSSDETGDRTQTSIQELDQSSRTMELARMLGGAEPSPEALALSKKMLNL